MALTFTLDAAPSRSNMPRSVEEGICGGGVCEGGGGICEGGGGGL